MIRLVTISLFGAVLVLAGGLYRIKYQTEATIQDGRRILADISTEREHLRLLEAEWANVNAPRRLEVLARRHLNLDLTAPKRIVRLDTLDDTLPFRQPDLDAYNSDGLSDLIEKLPDENGAPEYDTDALTNLLMDARASAAASAKGRTGPVRAGGDE